MNIELPRAVEAYFAFAELPATERGRHFTITFTYMEGGRLDRLQWWWQVSKIQERRGEAVVQAMRQEAIGRFRQHIERWLFNSSRCLKGGDPFPQLEQSVTSSASAEPVAAPTEATAEQAIAERAVTEQQVAYVKTVREFARLAVGG
jgi:hypothetical protein